MAIPRPAQTRRLLVGLAPLALSIAALPLLAPTCGSSDSEGDKTFSRNSLIIPMDRCYQYQTDVRTGTGQPANCPQSADPGDVIKAYGLVYQLIRHDVAVYWVINQTKTAFDSEDFHIQYDAGAPAFRYDWNTGGSAAPPTNGHTVAYKGGPFVVDGSDYAKASAVLQQIKSTFSPVRVHVANVAFTAHVKKTMAGGWNAGGAVPPKLALLDIGSGNLTQVSPPAINDPKNAQPVIQGYLARAGIGSGTAGGTATGTHGEIYDLLGIDDFQPDASGIWSTSNLGKNGYQILWVPHWLAAGSCSNYSSASTCANSLYPAAKRQQVLATVQSFVNQAGGDLFAECAGLGSFEGGLTNNNNTATSAANFRTDYPSPAFPNPPGAYPAVTGTNFLSLTGMRINEVNIGAALVVPPGQYGSPLMQLGDYPFVPVDGAIKDYRPADASGTPPGGYQPATVRLFGANGSNTNWDYFTFRPRDGARGSIVYLSGHSYSGVQGEFQIGGSRLVLNTLFNLGAGCTESGVACDTGLLGVCSLGRLTCTGSPPQPTCVPVNTPGPEICNGLDDDCNGLVDEGLETSCYDGPAGTDGVGLCRAGVSQCVQDSLTGAYGMSACQGEVLPAPEVCNALDDNCDGQVDENLTQSCYDGPLYSIDPVTKLPMGVCRPGTQTCTEGNWGPCTGEVLPGPELCNEGAGQIQDDDCDGQLNNGCTCTVGEMHGCYSGPAGTLNVGLCHGGTTTCVSTGGTGTGWGPCVGEVVPTKEICNNGIDEDCNGPADDGPPQCSTCNAGDTQPCYTGPAGTDTKGVCHGGTQACVNGEFSGACVGEQTPAPSDPCDGLDNDCNGLVDDGAACAIGFACEQGVCVPSTCGSEQPCPEGYDCTASGCKLSVATACTGNLCVGGCLDSQACNDVSDCTCQPGRKCQFGACADPCEGVSCGQGAVCASGACVGGSCYFTGCPAGQLCLQGACQADPCSGVDCPSGTFCRQGDCVQACTFVACQVGQKCGIDGFCVPDSCAGKSCGAGKRCTDGACVDDPCAGTGCGSGQVCQPGTCQDCSTGTCVDTACAVCVDDPCTGVTCPAGACVAGQCYPLGNPGGVGTVGQANPGTGGCGCGAGGGVDALGALLGLLALPLARRRPGRRGRGGGAAVLLLLAAAATLATGCKKSTPFDPEKCEVTCEGENRCIDLQTDPSHCGACGQACGSGNQCVDGVCGPSSLVAPQILSLAPGNASIGGVAPVTITVEGARFQQGATVRATSTAGTATLDTHDVTASQLKVDLDLEDAIPGTWQLRVVNPDRVISNSQRLDVVVPNPTVTAVAAQGGGPAQVVAGTVTVLRVTGTGLGAISQCFLSSATTLDTGLVTVPVEPPTTPPSLDCTVDASLLATGTYQIWVVNYGTVPSNKNVSFPVVSATPVIDTVSPSVVQGNTNVAFTIVGSGFDQTSTAHLDGGAAINTAFLNGTQLFLPSVAIPACGTPPCDHALTVVNGGVATSNAFTIQASAAPPQVTGVSPGTAYQGEIAVVTFQGSGFAMGTNVQAAPPLGSFVDLASTVTGSTQVQGTLDLNGQPEGAWQLRLAYPGGFFSSSYSFRVLSNQAILYDASPLGGAQGASPSVTFTVGNIRSPYAAVRVLFSRSDLSPAFAQLVTPTSANATTVIAPFSLVGLDTGTYVAQVVNPCGSVACTLTGTSLTPGSTSPSNGVGINVTPGPPTVSMVSPTSAARGDTAVAITLTGTNFARPPVAGGTGGSTVHIAAPALGINDYAIPVSATTVTNPTQIVVQLDTRTGVPGKYDVSVWNPGGATPPQKSNVLSQAFEILP